MPRIDVLTLFPRMLDGFLAESILGKGLERGLLSVSVHDLRAWTTDKHRTADDRPFGGGAGMVMKPEPVFAAIEQLQTPGCRRIYLTPDGVPLSPAIAELPRGRTSSSSPATTRASTRGSGTASSTWSSASATTC
jgi:tRNA (guanine37-N1)-methyltransferase